ncbi:hypothetical protein [Acinetobacter sp. NIPH 298]|uniref:hypothetical protein n=1 Tax=Acinetobacter sp. NIPH 298 TaxID=1217692 RepID=UPI0002CE1273|nr:hypothetical protein [Acinetobacter sp. NIPH 298]ENW95948.1 hypothetical protein F903_01716 [Acinetobacter sp. NIPH 298]
MTRDEACKLLECSYKGLADYLLLTTAAIARWGDREIPYDREYEIKELAAGRTPKRIREAKQKLTQTNI